MFVCEYTQQERSLGEWKGKFVMKYDLWLLIHSHDNWIHIIFHIVPFPGFRQLFAVYRNVCHAIKTHE